MLAKGDKSNQVRGINIIYSVGVADEVLLFFLGFRKAMSGLK